MEFRQNGKVGTLRQSREGDRRHVYLELPALSKKRRPEWFRKVEAFSCAWIG
jgi:hypothetical protein